MATLIDPSKFPTIDTGAVDDGASALKKWGDDLKTDVTALHTTWGRLKSCYHSPEQESVYALMDKPKSAAEDVASDFSSASTALETFSDELAKIETDLKNLRAEAEEFRKKAEAGINYYQPPRGAYVRTGLPDPEAGHKHKNWDEDQWFVGENNRLLMALDGILARINTAETNCANDILRLVDGNLGVCSVPYQAIPAGSFVGSGPNGESNPWGSVGEYKPRDCNDGVNAKIERGFVGAANFTGWDYDLHNGWNHDWGRAGTTIKNAATGVVDVAWSAVTTIGASPVGLTAMVIDPDSDVSKWYEGEVRTSNGFLWGLVGMDYNAALDAAQAGQTGQQQWDAFTRNWANDPGGTGIETAFNIATLLLPTKGIKLKGAGLLDDMARAAKPGSMAAGMLNYGARVLGEGVLPATFPKLSAAIDDAMGRFRLPGASEGSPRVDVDAPRGDGGSPTLPKVDVDSPRVDVDVDARPGVEAPKVSVDVPAVDVDAPRVDVEAPKVDADAVAPAPKADAPDADAPAPKQHPTITVDDKLTSTNPRYSSDFREQYYVGEDGKLHHPDDPANTYRDGEGALHREDGAYEKDRAWAEHKDEVGDRPVERPDRSIAPVVVDEATTQKVAQTVQAHLDQRTVDLGHRDAARRALEEALREVGADPKYTPDDLSAGHMDATLKELQGQGASRAEIQHLRELAKEWSTARGTVGTTGEAIGTTGGRAYERTLDFEPPQEFHTLGHGGGHVDDLLVNEDRSVIKVPEYKGMDSDLSTKPIESPTHGPVTQGSPGYIDEVLQRDERVAEMFARDEELWTSVKEGRTRIEYEVVNTTVGPKGVKVTVEPLRFDRADFDIDRMQRQIDALRRGR